jgi:hypothetical protein
LLDKNFAMFVLRIFGEKIFRQYSKGRYILYIRKIQENIRVIKILPLMAKLAKILLAKISVYTVHTVTINEPQPMIVFTVLTHALTSVHSPLDGCSNFPCVFTTYCTKNAQHYKSTVVGEE